jgi:hypothetical protein
MVLCIAVALAAARWSAVRMASEINRQASAGDRISMKWWPNYKDRRVLRRYRSEIPSGRLHLVYFGCMVGAFTFLIVGIALGVHST